MIKKYLLQNNKNILLNLILLFENKLNNDLDLSSDKKLLDQIEINLIEYLSENQNINDQLLIIIYTLFEHLKILLKNDCYLKNKNEEILNSFIKSTQENNLFYRREFYLKKLFPSFNKNSSTLNTISKKEENTSTFNKNIELGNKYKCDHEFFPITKSQDRNQYKELTAFLCLDWLQINQKNPYMSKVEKKIISKITGLGEEQVSNWFVNARRRILPGFLKSKHFDL